MISPEKSRRSLARMLSERLIPLADSRQNSLLLMDPAHLARQQYQFTLHAGTPLDDEKNVHSRLYLNQWPQRQVHAVRYPCIVAVVEGEIDWRIGITRSRLAALPAHWAQSDYLIMPFKAGDFFMMPPGVPYSMGNDAHWERTAPRDGSATLFWMLVLPAGVMCHSCRSDGAHHTVQPLFFVPCKPAYLLAQMLTDELNAAHTDLFDLARGHLHAMMCYVYRSLYTQGSIRPNTSETTLYSSPDNPLLPAKDAVQRAQIYIETHLQSPLNARIIAANAYVSARQLDRYFQRDFGMTVMQFVAARRVQQAKVLLQDTDMSVQQIGAVVGYPNPSSFAQIFKRRTGMSPQESRQSHTQSDLSEKMS